MPPQNNSTRPFFETRGRQNATVPSLSNWWLPRFPRPASAATTPPPLPPAPPPLLPATPPLTPPSQVRQLAAVGEHARAALLDHLRRRMERLAGQQHARALAAVSECAQLRRRLHVTSARDSAALEAARAAAQTAAESARTLEAELSESRRALTQMADENEVSLPPALSSSAPPRALSSSDPPRE